MSTAQERGILILIHLNKHSKKKYRMLKNWKINPKSKD